MPAAILASATNLKNRAIRVAIPSPRETFAAMVSHENLAKLRTPRRSQPPSTAHGYQSPKIAPGYFLGAPDDDCIDAL
jgi:hypothetical protein